ncbi:hypothetical protein [Anaeromyxobacter dehalogenans]|uniref:Uncharacterized protein n=1 Tax=Anaeromyxobacter dehalogenans (strain 2CP-C) TaxID=290397 RepID=Q2IGG4_ANADE|nr:hypothetical protein [Anaeromyxobacter dehalogenans]ABC83668.1 hypothetical protein Adeh_3904 [Anaeromyxobacter dehalogenans 2CP-C]
MDLEKGMLVQHVSLGVGKVVAVERDAVHVYFASGDGRVAAKLKLPTALPFLTAAAGANAWLAALPAFRLAPETGRYEVADGRITQAEALERYRAVSPEAAAGEAGAEPPKVRRDRAWKWRRAHEAWEQELGGGEGERLLAAGDVGALVARAVKVEHHVRPLLPPAERPAFAAALSDPESARELFAALFALLAAPKPEQEAFERLAAAVAALPAPPALESRWQVLTLLPFVARPDVHMLVEPRTTCAAALRLGIDLAYTPEPSWATYTALLAATGRLLAQLEPLGARDHVDVDTFLHANVKAPPRTPRTPPARRTPRVSTAA